MFPNLSLYLFGRSGSLSRAISEAEYKLTPMPHLRSRVVGRRRAGGGGWESARVLQRTLAAVRGTNALVPRGVYRFATFEEADEWMIRSMARTHASRRSKTLRESVPR